MSEGLASRRAALAALRRAHRDDAWGGPALDQALTAARLDARDRAFATALALDTLRREGTLDWALEHVLDRPLAHVEPEVRDILRLGAWQLGYGRVPARAAVSTSVALAREAVGARVTGFVNGVLRGLARRWEQLPWPPTDTDEGLGLATGYPTWVVAAARARFGAEAEAVLEAGNAPPGVTLRARPGERDALLSELRAAGIDATAGAHSPLAVRAPGADPRRLPAVADGRAVVQDEASMLVVEALSAWLEPGARVLDLCAAPGGKATDLAARGHRVAAGDVHPGRAGQIADLARRVGERVDVAVVDGTASAWAPTRADAALVDAPCTGLGTVRRRPELRWRRDPGDPEELAELQVTLVHAAADAVRPGGVVCYSACTWTRVETLGVVERVLDGGTLESLEQAQLRPDLHDTDGMFYAVMRRT